MISMAQSLSKKVLQFLTVDDDPPFPFDDTEGEEMWRASKKEYERRKAEQKAADQQVKERQRWTSQKLKKPRPQGRGFLLIG
jgi:hypothetical protein